MPTLLSGKQGKGDDRIAAVMDAARPPFAALLSAVPGRLTARTMLVALTALLSLIMPPPPAGAQDPGSDPLQAAGAAGSLVLTAEGGGARLALPGGKSLLVPLPAGAELSSLAALAGGRWAAAGSVPAAEGGHRLLLLRGDAAGFRPLAAPPGQTGRERHGPVLLVKGGALAGLAWLEGAGGQSLGVRAARLQDGRWTAPATVAPPGPGSQLALAGAVLADGSWLLAWSAFDGDDDEILWSRSGAGARAGAGWTAPRRAADDNRVPDITPALAAAGDGALLSWSRYDGNDYRLVTARLTGPAAPAATRRAGAGHGVVQADGTGGAWSAPATIGPAGSLYPAFSPTAGNGPPKLLYFTARPRAWSLLELDAAGKVLRRAEIPVASADRPVVTSDRKGGVHFSWPGRGEAKAALQPVQSVERER